MAVLEIPVVLPCPLLWPKNELSSPLVLYRPLYAPKNAFLELLAVLELPA